MSCGHKRRLVLINARRRRILETRMEEFKGIGPVTVQIFCREL
jgi:hypothetical protein